MKRLVTFLLFVVMAVSFSLQAKETRVTTATELSNAWYAAADGDVIVCAPGTYSYGSGTPRFPIGRTFTVKSENPDSMAVIVCDIGIPNAGDGAVAGGIYHGGLIFEEIDLRQRSGAAGSSGHIIYLNMFDGILHIDQLVFRNCIINQSPRGLVRTVVPRETVDGVEVPKYPGAGDIDYFEMSNCLIRDIFTTSGNNWPLVYLSHFPVEMVFEGNTFYNMPYIKNIFTMNYAERETGRNARILFKNNTFAHTFGSSGAYVATSDYLGEETEFIFENNLFALPNWVNDLNLDPDPEAASTYTVPTIISCRGGIITTTNNLVEGPRPWSAGNRPDADGDGGFLVIDTINTYTMADLGISWDDFADPERADFAYLSSIGLATAGTDGDPIGDPRWLRNFTNPVTLTTSANIEDARITPRRAYYESGSEATVTASIVDGSDFGSWVQLPGSTPLSTDNPYKFNIASDMNIQAVYGTVLNKDVEITISGSSTASYTISPVKDTYYVGDEISITLNTHYLNDFLGWSDGSMDLVRTITITDHVRLTANFKQNPYILAWDFHQLTGNNQTFADLEANHYKDEANKGVMNYVGSDRADISTRNNKYTGAGQEQINCAVRRTDDLANPSYLYVKFSSKDYSNLKVKSYMSSDNAIFTVQKMQYSLDGTDYVDFAEATIPSDPAEWDQKWWGFDGELPAEANDQEELYIRWIADNTSERLLSPNAPTSTQEFVYVARVIIYSSVGSGGASWRVDPNESYTAGEKITSVPGITLTLSNVGYNNVANPLPVTAEVTTLNGVEYVARLGGTENPRSATNGNYSNNNPAQIPVFGTFWKFDPTVDGELTMAVFVNADKNAVITEEGMVMGDRNVETIIDPSTGVPMAYTIDVTAGKAYHIFSTGSKMGIYGFVFKAGGTGLYKIAAKNTIYASNGTLFVDVEKAGMAEIYTVLGQRVAQKHLSIGLNEFALQSGIYIVRAGSDVQKVIVK